jgi:hypothetical protein
MSRSALSALLFALTCTTVAGCATPPPLEESAASEAPAAEADLVGQVNDLSPPPAIGSLKDRRSPACGQPVTQNGRGLAYRGVAVYSNGACQGTGISCAKDYSAGAIEGFRANGASEECLDERNHLGPQPQYVGNFDPSRRSFNRWQCAEFVKRVFAILFGAKGWEGDAQEMLNSGNLPRGVVARMQGDAAHPPVPGDAVVYSGGQYGHVAMIVAVDLPNLTIVGQNEALQARGAEWRNGILTDRGTTMRILGWAHATNNPEGGGAAAPQGGAGNAPPPPAQPNPNAGRTPCPGDFQHWNCTGDGTARLRCEDGFLAETQACPNGCESRAVGQDDVCRGNAPPAQPAGEPAAPDASECNDRDYEYYECNADLMSRFRCRGGRWETEACPGGCDRRWWDDLCMDPQADVPAEAPRAEAVERDGRCDRSWQRYNCIEGGSARILCDDGYLVDYEQCAEGCVAQASGQDDVCAGDRGAAADEGFAPPRAIPVCADTCASAWDGECDDGGPGALYAVCYLGTDCGDCGDRE